MYTCDSWVTEWFSEMRKQVSEGKFNFDNSESFYRLETLICFQILRLHLCYLMFQLLSDLTWYLCLTWYDLEWSFLKIVLLFYSFTIGHQRGYFCHSLNRSCPARSFNCCDKHKSFNSCSSFCLFVVNSLSEIITADSAESWTVSFLYLHFVYAFTF